MEPSLSEPPVAPVEPGPEVVTYELVEEASKQRRTKLIDSRGYSYNVKRRTKSATIWQCSVRTKSSYCKATVKEIHGQFTETQSHNHQPAVGAVTAAKVVTAVKRKALEDVFKPAPAIVHEVKRHCIFHYINIAITNMVSYFLQVLLEEMSTAPCPAMSKPVHLARAANRLRQSNRPADLTSIDFDLREDVLPENFLRVDITTRNGRNLIFASDEQLNTLREARTWYIDGTFKLVRRPFQQLLSVNAFVRKEECAKQVPLVFVLMSGRRKKDYKKVYIHLLFFFHHNNRPLSRRSRLSFLFSTLNSFII